MKRKEKAIPVILRSCILSPCDGIVGAGLMRFVMSNPVVVSVFF